MKIKTTEQVNKEIEIELPYFYKSKYGVFGAILSENMQIEICGSMTIATFNTPIAIDKTSIQITPEEFAREYDKTLEYLQSLKSKFFKPKQ